ncbi:MAG: hypothetical protein S4CHLAM6_07370 [Chlamydiae bacterium]|nr:hypothetical protein [Chlamydiota bacterium]
MTLEQKVFKTEILIQVSDINYGGHLGNDRFLTVAQEARIRWLRSHGWSEKNIGNTGNGFFVVEANLKYHHEVFLGQTLIVDLFISECTKCTCLLQYEFFEKESQRKVGSVSTKVAFFDYSKRKLSKVPLALLNMLEVHGE